MCRLRGCLPATGATTTTDLKGFCNLCTDVADACVLDGECVKMMDCVWVIEASLDTKHARLMTRNSFTSDQALARINSQPTSEERRRKLEESDKPFEIFNGELSLEVVMEGIMVAMRKMCDGGHT
eukprot:NODE_6649_length_829_cov_113.375354_g6413_i0.p2 GENE.NODE_6649_length_829_cov_113.375354_g6413_i0~~NODE_6649_length_829_cov_113.375354_g6413_i0.p2  ORF type:complete len:125 (-),score=14.57 NODE_6649_length_829_cov_113.375354_g6413_i0:237-611(-)